MDAKESSLQLINRFDASKAKGVNAIIQIKATGEGNNTHAIIIKDGKAEVVDGLVDNPNATIDVSAQDWVAINNGDLDPTMAFMSGKLRVGGDMGLMMRFQTIFGV